MTHDPDSIEPSAARRPDGTEPPPLLQAAVQPRGLRSSGALDSVGSVAAFLVGNRLGGLGLAIGLVTAWSLVAIVRRYRNGIGIGKLLPITTGYLLLRGAIGLATGSKAVYFGTSIATKAGIGLVLLGSVVVGRALITRYAPLVIPFPAQVLTHAIYRRTGRNLTILAGVYELASAAWDVWLYNRTSTGGFLVIRLVVAWASGFVTIFGGIIYADVQLKKIPGFGGLLEVMEELTAELSSGRDPGTRRASADPADPPA